MKNIEKQLISTLICANSQHKKKKISLFKIPRLLNKNIQIRTYSSLSPSFSKIIARGLIELGFSLMIGTKAEFELSILSLNES